MNSCMKQVLLILFVSLVLQEDVSSAASAKPSNYSNTSSSTPTPTTTPQTVTTLKNETINGTKVTENPENGSLLRGDDGMLKRSLYVAIGLSAFVAIYFIVRWIKTKRRRKAKKYGVIHGAGEMEPLDKHIDEDEEDMTLFDVKDAKRPR